jgi:hypothetical protein
LIVFVKNTLQMKEYHFAYVEYFIKVIAFDHLYCLFWLVFKFINHFFSLEVTAMNANSFIAMIAIWQLECIIKIIDYCLCSILAMIFLFFEDRVDFYDSFDYSFYHLFIQTFKVISLIFAYHSNRISIHFCWFILVMNSITITIPIN